MKVPWLASGHIVLFLTCDPTKSEDRRRCIRHDVETAQRLSNSNETNDAMHLIIERDTKKIFSRNKKKGPGIHPKRIRPRLPILAYQDEWVCINKPAGMTVHRSHKQSKKELVVTTTLKRQLARRVLPVHRLDHRTSGALLFAFSSEMAGQLQQSLQADSAQKTYIALLRGDWKQKYNDTTIRVDKPLQVHGEMKECSTIFTYLASTMRSHDEQRQLRSEQCCTLVSIHPKTGRKHQIRRHAFALGMPILGDTQHGDTRVNRWWRHHRGLNRLALHSLSLNLPSVNNNQNITVVAPLPEDLRTVLEQDVLYDLWKTAVENEPRLATEFIDYRGGTLGTTKKWQQQARDAE